MPSFERDRIHGESNLNTFRDGFRVLRTILRERLTRLHAPGPAWAALTGQLRYESVEQSASDKVDAALSRLLDGAADA